MAIFNDGDRKIMWNNEPHKYTDSYCAKMPTLLDQLINLRMKPILVLFLRQLCLLF